mgnify:FL=1
MEEKLNIKINFILPATSAYDESLQIMMASGNYDDVVLYPSATNNTFLEGVENGLYIAVNDLLPSYENILKYTAQAEFEE